MYFVLYLVLSLLVTHPLIFNLDQILIGWPLDAYNYLWNIDTFWRQIFSLQNPFFTNRIFYPLGTSLFLHTYAPLISLLGLPFLKNIPLYLNLFVILSPALSAYSTYILVKYLTQDKISSFLAGAVFGLSPVMISFLVSQHYYFAFAAPILPLSILFLIKFLEKGQIKNLAIFITLFWICIGIDYYTSIILLMLGASLSVVYFVFNVQTVVAILKEKMKSTALIIFGLMVFPGMIIAQKFSAEKSHYPAICSATIRKLFTPSEFNPLLGRPNALRDYDTPSIFLGFLVPLGGLLSLFLFKPKEILPFVGMGVFLLLFSLGPPGKLFNLVASIPPLGLIDCPQRFIIGVQLVLAILFGLTLSKFNKTRFKKIIFLLGGTAVLGEYLTSKLPNSTIEIPEIYKTLATKPSNKAVLELPSGIAESKGAFGYDWSIQGLLLKQMYWQTLHGKDRIGGYTSRLDKSYYTFFENESVISDLFRMTSLNGKWGGKVFNEKDISNFVAKFNLGYIILSPNQNQSEFARVVEEVFGKRIIQKESVGGFVLYTID